MKFVWFNLMPWPHMPDDFREKHRSVWVDIDQALYDPVEGHRVYHEYMDQLEFADSLGYDGIGVNEHHQNGYGLMPSPNIIAAGLARRTSKAAICVIGNSIALYNPPIRVAEEFAMLDVISGGRLVAGFPVGTSMDTNYCYGQIPALTRDKYAENHDLIMKAWRETEPFAFDGKYNQLQVRELLAEADPAAAPADLHPGRRLDRDVGLLHRARVQLLVPVLRRVPRRQGAARRVLGPRRAPRRRRVAVPRRVRPDDLRRRHRRGGRGALRRARPVLLQPVSARVSRLRRRAGLPHDQDAEGRRAEPAHRGGSATVLVAHVEGPRRGRPRDRRLTGHGARADGGHDQGPAHRHRVRTLPRRQHA